MSALQDQPLTIVFLDRDTLSPETTLKPINYPHRLVTHSRTRPEEVAERIADADIVIVNKVPVREDALASARRLKLVALSATGTDNVDVKAANGRGITVSNIRNYAGHTVPEHTFALILALQRNILAYRDSVKAGRWQEAGQFCYFDYPIKGLAGSTLGIIGDGVLGKAVADLGRAFGMKVLFSDYKGSTGMGPLYTPFDEVMRVSDVITLHLPLMASTRDLVGEREFALMERRPILVNTARGGLVNEDALHAALTSGKISGAGFDVVTKEPPELDSPLMRLLELPNFILTPHVAWASQDAIQGLADQLVDNINAFIGGAPRNVVVPM
ncbi:MAG: D-2-hydroxyacid dehydrogenase [Bauldia sp.]|nr:D-2-hydroxyacid dehydrogenase [Bauldia sp.]